MKQFKEKMGSIFLMNEKEEIQYEVTEPAMFFDKDFFVLHKIGNKNDVMNYYEACIDKCKNSGTDLFASWVVMDLPKDADLLDKILQGFDLESILKNDLQIELNF